jgi:hypothetical protein
MPHEPAAQGGGSEIAGDFKRETAAVRMHVGREETAPAEPGRGVAFEPETDPFDLRGRA